MTAYFCPTWFGGHRIDIASLRRTYVVGVGLVGEIDGLITGLANPTFAAAIDALTGDPLRCATDAHRFASQADR